MKKEKLGIFDRATIRVAFAAAGITAALLLVVSAVTDVVVQHSIVAGIDTRLQSRLNGIGSRSMGDNQSIQNFGNPDQQVVNVPLAVWVYDGSGVALARTPLTSDLPSNLRQVTSPTNINLNGTEFRVAGEQIAGVWVMVGQSLAVADDDVSKLLTTELLVGPLILLLVFGGAIAIGRRVARPIEAARQRQLAFTADASHELRTPLAVIEAETALALEKGRSASDYRGVLERIGGESGRLRHIVDSLLWLARFDAAPQTPGSEPIDLTTAAKSAGERFAAVATQRELDLQVVTEAETALIIAPPEWIERLIGVLLDNACKYTPTGGTVRATATENKGRVTLTVEDSGPGVPPEEQLQIFDRFHRAAGNQEGAGLGLAIGNAVVSATDGTWDVGVSDLGGARFSVTWSVAGQ